MLTFNRKDIENLLAPVIYRRAEDYHRRGKLVTLEIEEFRIGATVEGSNSNLYTVDIELGLDGELERVDCTCPYGSVCKHIGAVLLECVDRQKPYTPLALPPSEGEEIIPFREGGSPQSDILRRLQREEQRPASAQPGTAPRLLFAVSGGTEASYLSGDVVYWITPLLCRLKQDGRLGRCSSYRSGLPTEPLGDKERVLLTSLEQKQDLRQPLARFIDFILSDPPVELFLLQNGLPRPVQTFEIQRTAIRFQLHGLKDQRPLFSPVLDFHSDQRMSSLTVPFTVHHAGPILYLLDETNALLLHRSGDAPYRLLLSELTERDSPFTYADIRYLSSYIGRHFDHSLRLDFPAKQLRLLHRRPVPILELEDRHGSLQADLLFRYEQRVFPFRRQETLLRLEGSSTELLAVQRDTAFEQDRYEYLRFHLSSTIQSVSRHGSAGALFSVSGDLVGFLLNNGPALIKDGFELYRRGKKVRTVDRLSFSVSRDMDWLDIHTRLLDESGQLFPVQVNAEKLQGSFLESRDACYLLSERDILRVKDLFRQGMDRKGILRVTQQHYSLIDELYEQIENNDQRDLRRMHKVAQGLKDFSGIATVRPPRRFNGTLRAYQKAGLNWLHFLYRYNISGCLADDMGLGKTIQALALLQGLKERGKLDTVLILAPLSTLPNWRAECQRFTPELLVVVHHGLSRTKEAGVLKRSDVIIVSYHTLRNDIELFKDLPLTYLILDEAQIIKNPASQIHRSVRVLQAEHRLSLTGTPVENTTTELWAQMNFLNPGLLGSLQSFRRKFVKPIETDDSEAEKEQLKRLVAPFILRRRKENVLDDLPPKEEITLYTDMSAAQRKVYASIRASYRRQIVSSLRERGIGRSAMVIFEALLKMRQAALFPELADARHAGVASCKFDLLRELLPEILAEGHKVLVFSQFLGSLRIIRDWIKQQEIDFCYLDGKTRNRQKQIDSFQRNPEKKVFLLSLKAGGLGINLTAADYVILFDPWWNPAVELQAVDRSHRIGQTRKVITYKMITRETVEEKILKLQERKKQLVQDLVVSERGFFKSLEREDLLKLFEA